jgi:hypothetical protein
MSKLEREEAYLKMEDYLHDSHEEAFGNSIRSPCLLHPGQRCAIFEVDDVKPRLQTLCVADSPETIDTASSQDVSSNHSGDATLARVQLYHNARWSMFEGGSSCKDYSSRGLCMQAAGPSAKPFLIMIAEVCHVKPRLQTMYVCPSRWPHQKKKRRCISSQV